MRDMPGAAGLWFVLAAVWLCAAQGLRAQLAKIPALASDGSNRPALIAATTGCGYSPEEAPAAPGRPQPGSGKAETKSGQPSLVLISSHRNHERDNDLDNDSDNAAIVGLWKFTFTATSAFAGPFDAGYVTWHSDGTELMNSGRAPTTGDFCMGVWKQTGRSTYRLNHFALAWAFDASAPATGPGTGGATITGTVTATRITAD